MSGIELEALKKLKARIDELRELAYYEMKRGGPKDFSEYRYLLGGVKSLDDVETVANEIFDDLMKGD